MRTSTSFKFACEHLHLGPEAGGIAEEERLALRDTGARDGQDFDDKAVRTGEDLGFLRHPYDAFGNGR